jgi:hypothetical protein
MGIAVGAVVPVASPLGELSHQSSPQDRHESGEFIG